MTRYPAWANACETSVEPENPSRTTRAFTLRASARMCGSSLRFEPAYLTLCVAGASRVVSSNIARFCVINCQPRRILLPLRSPPSGPIDTLQRALAAENRHGIEQPQAD